MWKELCILWDFTYVCPSCGVCGDDIFIVGCDESTLIHKRGNV